MTNEAYMCPDAEYALSIPTSILCIALLILCDITRPSLSKTLPET